MIDRNAGWFEVTCDECPDGHESYDVDDGWHSMIAELKEAGWKIIPIDEGEDFKHICPACAEPQHATVDDLVDDLFEDIFR